MGLLRKNDVHVCSPCAEGQCGESIGERRKYLHLDIYIGFTLVLTEIISTKVIIMNFGSLSNNFSLLLVQGCIFQNITNSKPKGEDFLHKLIHV